MLVGRFGGRSQAGPRAAWPPHRAYPTFRRRSWLLSWPVSRSVQKPTAAALYSVVGPSKHLGIDPFAYLRQVLPALFGFGQSPGAEALAEWLPDVWCKRQQAVAAAGSPATAPSVEPALT